MKEVRSPSLSDNHNGWSQGERVWHYPAWLLLPSAASTDLPLKRGEEKCSPKEISSTIDLSVGCHARTRMHKGFVRAVLKLVIAITFAKPPNSISVSNKYHIVAPRVAYSQHGRRSKTSWGRKLPAGKSSVRTPWTSHLGQFLQDQSETGHNPQDPYAVAYSSLSLLQTFCS